MTFKLREKNERELRELDKMENLLSGVINQKVVVCRDFLVEKRSNYGEDL